MNEVRSFGSRWDAERWAISKTRTALAAGRNVTVEIDHDPHGWVVSIEETERG